MRYPDSVVSRYYSWSIVPDRLGHQQPPQSTTVVLKEPAQCEVDDEQTMEGEKDIPPNHSVVRLPTIMSSATGKCLVSLSFGKSEVATNRSNEK